MTGTASRPNRSYHERMYFEQFYLGCLAHASYMLGSQGEAVVVDPQRDVDLYLKAAEENGLTIRHIFETHLHADFVSGHKELAARTGAKIYFGAQAGATFPHVAVQDGFELRFGQARIKVLETPGHTLESICLVVTSDDEKAPKPWAVLTGDTLFIGDVGRPDLSRTLTPQQLAGMLYDSLHDKLLKLPDEVLVYPAHGAGSLCGRNMRAERSSTIGTERLTNYALQIPSREEFIRQLTSNLPARPEYFLQDAEINRGGAPALSDLPELKAVSPAELKIHAGRGRDRAGYPARRSVCRRPRARLRQHSFVGTIRFLGGNDSRSVVASRAHRRYAGAVVRSPPSPGPGWHRSRTRIPGRRRCRLEAGAGFDLADAARDHVQELQQQLAKNGMQVLDVRREAEFMAGHIEEAAWWPLDRFRISPPEVDLNVPLAVHCQSGYRSMIACSLLQRAGFQNVVNVSGGFGAWQEAKLPVATGAPVEA